MHVERGIERKLGLRVLIADDDSVSRLILKRAIEKFGHECIVAEDGLVAWERYQNTSRVDLIISDYMMPGIDGLELCRRVRQKERSRYTFFIILTSLADKTHQLRGMLAGADNYLTKPPDPELLQVYLIAVSRMNSLVGGSTDGKQGQGS